MTEKSEVCVLFVKRRALLAGALSLLGLLGLAAFAAMGRSALLPNSRERWSRAGGCLSWGDGQGLPNGGGGRGLSLESGEGGLWGRIQKAFKARSACLERLVRGDATGLVPTVGEC